MDKLPEKRKRVIKRVVVPCEHDRTRPDVAGTMGGKRRCIDCGAVIS